jgi:beta-lactam-binding protein with PASTA domain
MRKRFAIPLLIAAVVAASAGSIAHAGARPHARTATAKVRVPSVNGVPWSTARYIFMGVGVKTNVVHPGKVVVKTSPKGGTRVASGSLVKVWLG